jgi:hypothetical protein
MTQATADQLRKEWNENPRWAGIERPYTAEDVLRLRGSLRIEYTLARVGAEKLWRSLHEEDFVNALQLQGMRRDINLDSLIDVAGDVARHFDREMPGCVYKTGPIRAKVAA